MQEKRLFPPVVIATLFLYTAEAVFRKACVHRFQGLSRRFGNSRKQARKFKRRSLKRFNLERFHLKTPSRSTY